MNPTGFFARIFFWLSGASDESLRDCPAWERRKYVAFGATVLVPTLFALIASAYAVSTLTDNWAYIIPIALVWAFIILTVDRALLATYRAYQSWLRKMAQFSLRIVVAALMGLTISHPLALLLFRDTVSTVIEKHRDIDIANTRTEFAELKAATETRMTALTVEVTELRQKWDATFQAEFLASTTMPGEEPLSDEEAAAKKALEAKIAAEAAPYRDKIAAIEKELGESEVTYKTIQAELDHWQTEFERELNGQRSGIVGLGPRAKSIQTDQLEWRREESKRLASVVESLTTQRNLLREEVTLLEQRLADEANMAAAAQLAIEQAENARLQALKQQVQQQQADSFVDQQNLLRATLKEQIDSRIAQTQVIQEEMARLSQDEQARVTAIRAEPRRDILTQTLALHELFDSGAEGGQFALAAYVILTLLFMLVDTIPLVVKFFSKPGPYDSLLDCDEVRFDTERHSFLRSYKRYMEDLGNGRMLHLTRNKPLELALLEGVERSRAAKEFLESLLELEKSFEERMRLQREQMAASGEVNSERLAMMEDVMRTFYADLRERMERFFAPGSGGSALTRGAGI